MKRHKDETTLKIETKMLWMAFENFLEAAGEKHRMEGIPSKKFHFSFKQKICQIIQNTKNYENAIMYSTKENRIEMNGNECYVFDIIKIKVYTDIETAEFRMNRFQFIHFLLLTEMLALSMIFLRNSSSVK